MELQINAAIKWPGTKKEKANEVEKAGLFTTLNDTVAPSPNWLLHCCVHTTSCHQKQCGETCLFLFRLCIS